MSLFVHLASLTTTGLVLASGGPSAQAQAQNQIQLPPPEPKITKVTVQQGDYLSKIADQYKTTWRRLYDANTVIKDPNLINPGDEIRIPGDEEDIPPRSLPEDITATPVDTASTTNQASPVHYAAAANYSTPANAGVWSSLAKCESGGNWAINTGNGYYGGLQFTAGTWISNGGGAYAPTANLATPDQQIAIASKLQAARGWAPWPACAAKLGLL